MKKKLCGSNSKTKDYALSFYAFKIIMIFFLLKNIFAFFI